MLFESDASRDRTLLDWQRWMPFALDALGTSWYYVGGDGCSWNRMLPGTGSSTQTILWFGHGCSGDRVLVRACSGQRRRRQTMKKPETRRNRQAICPQKGSPIYRNNYVWLCWRGAVSGRAADLHWEGYRRDCDKSCRGTWSFKVLTTGVYLEANYNLTSCK